MQHWNNNHDKWAKLDRSATRVERASKRVLEAAAIVLIIVIVLAILHATGVTYRCS